MPKRQGHYFLVWVGSRVRHIQSYREMTLPLCGVATRKGVREVCEGAEPEVDAMELCEHCAREAQRIASAAKADEREGSDD